MALHRDAAGNLWDATGPDDPNPVLVQQAGAAQPQMPSKPGYQYEGQKAKAETTTAEAKAAVSPAMEQLNLRQKAAQVAKAERENSNATTEEAINNLSPNSAIHGEEYLQKYVPLAQQALVRAYARGDLGSRAGGLSASMLPIIQHAMNYDPSASGTNFGARAKMQSDLAGSQPNTAGGSLRAMERMLLHGREVLHGGAALDNFGPGIFGAIGNTVRTAYDHSAHDPTLGHYDALVQNYAPESQKAIAQTAGGVDERGDRLKALDGSLSQQTRAARLQADAQQAFDAMSSVNDQYHRLMGHDIKDAMSPQAKAAYDEIMAGGYDKDGNPLHPASGWTPISAPPTNGETGGGTPPPSPLTDNGGPGAQGIAAGATRMIDNPKANGIINGLMNAGASKAMIDATLQKAGFPGIRPADYTAASIWMKKNPGKRYEGATAKDTVTMSPLERAAGLTAGSTVGGAGLTGVMNAADEATAGTIGAIGGERFRGNMDALSAMNPDSAAVGSIGGGVAGAMGGELGLAAGAGKLGLDAAGKIAPWIPRVSDGLYGAVGGFNGANPGDGGSGAVTGALAGVGGGLLGEGAAHVAGSMFRGVTDPAVRYLTEHGIPLTVGQTVGNSGRIGGAIKGIEDAATSVPLVGDMINARRTEGLRGFNQAAFRDAGAPINANIDTYGAQGIRDLADAKNAAYSSALDPIQIDALNDPAMIADMVHAQNVAGTIPEQVAPSFPREYSETSLNNRITGAIDPNTGMIDGAGFQNGYRGLARDARTRPAATADYGHEIGQAGRAGQDVLAAALERQNPGAFDQFLAANAANRNLSTLAAGVKSAENQPEKMFTPAQLNRADERSTSKFVNQVESSAGNRPFYDLTAAGQSVLPSKLGDSGTMKRLVVGGLLAPTALGGTGYAVDGGKGAGGALGIGALGTAALLAGGTGAGQRMLTAALLRRSPELIAIGEGLKRHASIGGGTLGAGLLASLMNGQ